MAYQIGNIIYRGSFKSIRNWKNPGDPKTYAGEKGGGKREQILKSPVFARTRENMREFKGCGMAVKAIYIGLLSLIPDHADTHFMARIVVLVKRINVNDLAEIHGSRAISFSGNREILRKMFFHQKKKIDFEIRKCIRTSHPLSRAEAIISIMGLNPNPLLVPGNAQYYRVVNHLNIISDYSYNKLDKKYKPLSRLNTMNAIAYSEYTPVNTSLTIEVKAAFPEDVVLTKWDTIIQSVGIEFYMKSGADSYHQYSEGSMQVLDVF